MNALENPLLKQKIHGLFCMAPKLPSLSSHLSEQCMSEMRGGNIVNMKVYAVCTMIGIYNKSDKRLVYYLEYACLFFP